MYTKFCNEAAHWIWTGGYLSNLEHSSQNASLVFFNLTTCTEYEKLFNMF